MVPNTWKLRTLYAIEACRTYLMGGHVDQCTNPECGKVHISYNSCRNRHCPKCQGHKKEIWIRQREKELLNTTYYHVVFTLPSELNKLAVYIPGTLYGLLFKVSWQVVQGFAANPKFLGAKTGMVAILHTWGQNLWLHPHLHCIVPGGGITTGHKWKNAKGKGKFLFPVKAMSKVFRAKFVDALRKELPQLELLYKQLFAQRWTVYCKRPFYGPSQVIEYLGRYTHKIAISNRRIKNVENGKVTFTAKDYRKGGKKHNVTLNNDDFIKRFALHIMPKGFVRIRHYGILASALKGKVLKMAEEQIGKVIIPNHEPLKHNKCPCCKIGELVVIARFDIRGPPEKVVPIGADYMIKIK
jgi:hypothetical protein